MKNSVFSLASMAIIALVLPITSASAQSVSSGQILDALQPKKAQETSSTRSFSTTRSFGAPKKETNPDRVSNAERSFIRSLGGTRAIKVEQRDKLIEIVEKSELPSVNIRILFAYDSDRIQVGSFVDLDEVAKALQNELLEDSKIMLNGHTDATGSRGYNQELSERRAVSVKRYLTHEHDIDATRLVVAGFGEDRLSDPDDPSSGKNRRVEIINLGE